MKKHWREAIQNWMPGQDQQAIACIDMHTGGEPLRVVLNGIPAITGETILAKRRWVTEQLDDVRKLLMFEPRGHADMYGCYITEPERADSDFGVLFLHNEGYSSMCGHAIIAVSKLAAQFNWVERQGETTTLRIDAPAGQVKSEVSWRDNKILGVRFENVPSYVVRLDCELETASLGAIRYDLAFGGAFYAYVDVGELDLELNPENVDRLIVAGKEIKQRVSKIEEIKHPGSTDLSFLYGTIFVGPPQDSNNHSRNVCVFADGEVDRSPTGTGVSGRAAIHHARGQLDLREPIRIESILGTTFDVEVGATCRFGEFDAIVPWVSGNAFITGRHEFLLDPDDPLSRGFIFR